ncbi:MAG: SH3 domain-containing protein [Clostridiales bacterium]|nr:SH3 domain-containing protein [Clostridiales bacterium]
MFPQLEPVPATSAAVPENGDEADGTIKNLLSTPSREIVTSNLTVTPRGTDEAEHSFAQRLTAWAENARTILTTTGRTMLLDEKTPVYTLSSSAAYRTEETAFLSSPGSISGLEQAAAQLLGELNANQQSLSLDPTVEKPFRGAFVPTGFTLQLFQTVNDANGVVCMDCAILSLTDTGGNPLEDPAYAIVRFFEEGSDEVICWLSADLEMTQLIAQMNQIRTSGTQGLSYSTTSEGETAPDWSSIVKTIGNGSAYNPDASGFTMGQSTAPVQAGQGTFDADGTFGMVGAFDPAASSDTAFFDPAMATPEPEPAVQYVSVKEGVTAASIRESPTTNSKRIAMAYPGVQYEFLGVTDYSWITIMTPDGLYGYISPKLVGPLPGEENGRRVTVTKSMTIHEEPTYYSNEPSSVRSGHSYYVINDKLEEWVQIRNTDGSIGYVNRKYIR